MPSALLALLVAATLPAPCAEYGDAVRTGTVPRALLELSGLAASHRHPGIYWAHNDSGNALELYAIREDGHVVGVFPLRGARTRDPEDVAVGPCAPRSAGSCVYLADTGDNLARRPEVQILRVPEPARLDGRPLQADALPFTYPDGPRDVEALVVEPGTARLFVVSKSFLSLGDVFRLDGLARGARGTAVRIGAVPMPRPAGALVTGADVLPAGERVLLRTYGRVWELRRPGATRLEDVFAATPVPVPSGTPPQAEAIAYRADGRGYLTGGEGAGSPLFRVDCAR
jgi:hypothetical protein